MGHESSAWRAGDAAAYEAARDAANTLTALLFAVSDADALEPALAIIEAQRIQLDLLSINAFDRADVDALLERLNERVAELSGLLR
ncbi:hypothetical protein [Microbacterium sp. P5_E9]